MSTATNYNTLFGDILSASIPEIKKAPKTFMEISGYPHYENVVSNILQFFFSPDGEHNFDTLFIQSLLSCINKKREIPFSFSTHSILVERESPGLEQTRIDILITSNNNDGKDEDSAIIIECKIWADLYNNLNHYWNAVTANKKVGIVLSLNKEIKFNHPGFINITFEEFSEEIIKNLGPYIPNSPEKYIVFLNDFLLNLSSLKTNKLMDSFYSFYYANIKRINQLAVMRDEITRKILDSIVLCGRNFDYTVTDLRATDYRCWLIEGRNDVYFAFYIDSDDKELNECLTISLFVDKGLVISKDKFISDVVLKQIAKESDLKIGTLYKGPNYVQIMAKEYMLKADFAINIEERLANINKDVLIPIVRRVSELLKLGK